MTRVPEVPGVWQLVELVGARFAGSARSGESSVPGLSDTCHLFLKGRLLAAGSWWNQLLVEQGLHRLAFPCSLTLWLGGFVMSWWVVKLCDGPSLWKFGLQGLCVIENSSGSSPCREEGPQVNEFRTSAISVLNSWISFWRDSCPLAPVVAEAVSSAFFLFALRWGWGGTEILYFCGWKRSLRPALSACLALSICP